MAQDNNRGLAALFGPNVTAAWIKESGGASGAGSKGAESEAAELLQALRKGLEGGGNPDSIEGSQWSAVRESLEALSRTRVAQGRPRPTPVRSCSHSSGRCSAACSSSCHPTRRGRWT